MIYILHFVKIIYLGFPEVLKWVVMMAHDKNKYDNRHSIID